MAPQAHDRLDGPGAGGGQELPAHDHHGSRVRPRVRVRDDDRVLRLDHVTGAALVQHDVRSVVLHGRVLGRDRRYRALEPVPESPARGLSAPHRAPTAPRRRQARLRVQRLLDVPILWPVPRDLVREAALGAGVDGAPLGRGVGWFLGAGRRALLRRAVRRLDRPEGEVEAGAAATSVAAAPTRRAGPSTGTAASS